MEHIEEAAEHVKRLCEMFDKNFPEIGYVVTLQYKANTGRACSLTNIPRAELPDFLRHLIEQFDVPSA